MSSRSRPGKRIVIPRFLFAVTEKPKGPAVPFRSIAVRRNDCAPENHRRHPEPRLSNSSKGERVFATRPRYPAVARTRPTPPGERGAAGARHRLTIARRGYLLIMSPRMWRLLISGSLRLFLISAVPAAAHLSVLAGLAATVIAFVVPPPRSRHEPSGPG
jgi:hypothetical protein